MLQRILGWMLAGAAATILLPGVGSAACIDNSHPSVGAESRKSGAAIRTLRQTGATAATLTKKAKVTGMFSSMAFHEESGDVLGDELLIVPTARGYFVVFQSSEGEPAVPVVVPAMIEGQDISFSLPKPGPGDFRGTITQHELIGSFCGNSEQMRLKRKNSYWQ